MSGMSIGKRDPVDYNIGSRGDSPLVRIKE